MAARAKVEDGKKSQAVLEHLILLRMDPDEVEAEQAKSCVENLWSLQYQMGGVICSSAGASDAKRWKALLGDSSLDSESVCRYTHAVHFRFPGRPQLDAFLESTVVRKIRDTEVAATGATTIARTFESTIPEDLFAIFRKGQDWDEGYEHLVVVKCDSAASAGARAAAMRVHFHDNQPSMEEYGLQQATFGQTLERDDEVGILMRFRNEYDFDYFTNTPLYASFIGASSIESLSLVTYPVGNQQASRNI